MPRRTKNNTTSYSQGRGTPRTANLRLPLAYQQFFPRPQVFAFQPSLPFTEIEDRRVFHPSGPVRPALNKNGRQHTLKASGAPALFSPRVGFEDAQRVLVCVRRKTRKEVLHARRKTGKKGQKSPNFNFLSSLTCK